MPSPMPRAVSQVVTAALASTTPRPFSEMPSSVPSVWAELTMTES